MRNLSYRRVKSRWDEHGSEALTSCSGKIEGVGDLANAFRVWYSYNGLVEWLGLDGGPTWEPAGDVHHEAHLGFWKANWGRWVAFHFLVWFKPGLMP